jgi:hypothetical protein
LVAVFTGAFFLALSRVVVEDTKFTGPALFGEAGVTKLAVMK